MQSTKKILIVAPSWVGDLVMAQSLFKVLKNRTPDVELHVLALQNLHQLLERMPEVDKILLWPFRHGELNLIGRFQLGRSLKSENYSQAIILPNTLKSALVPFFANIPKRTGWRGEMRFFLLNDLRILYPFILVKMVERYVQLGLPHDEPLPQTIPWPKLEISTAAQKTVLARLVLEKPEKIVALCPGAEYGPAKRWPAKYFAEIAKTFAAKDYAIWIFGGPNDQPVAKEIQALSKIPCIDLTGKTTLGEAADLLSLAKIAITNDSGLMHVAAAVDCNVFAIYGSSSCNYTPPLSKKAKIISLHLPCSPCFQKKCPFGHYHCLENLTPEKVLTAIEEIA
ncbi:MAG: lipopolysaccharide heptosyltransferase II [Gammaproteobacteria bacterium]|nr:lipopolysaccharide heptosyltransferase II [Gammaproteobacteria bacterium]